MCQQQCPLQGSFLCTSVYYCSNTHHSPSQPWTGTSVIIQCHLCWDKGLKGCDVSGTRAGAFALFLYPLPASIPRLKNWVSKLKEWLFSWLICFRCERSSPSAFNAFRPLPFPTCPWGQRKVVTKLFSVLQTDLRITCFSVSLGVRCSFTKCRFPSPSLDLVNTILWVGLKNPYFWQASQMGAQKLENPCFPCCWCGSLGWYVKNLRF